MARYSPFAQRALEKQTGMSFAEQMAEKAAKDAGFASVAAQQANRMMRNQLEEKAARLGVSNQEAYAKAGGDLTNTQALQNAWNQLTAPPKKEEAPAATVSSPQDVSPVQTTKPKGPSESDLMIKSLTDTIAGLQSGFTSSLEAYAAQSQQQQQAQNERMEQLQNMMIQQQASQAVRPTVTGVKTATGSAGDAMQVARRGVSGTFGRRGMRISSLNV